jgi:phage repressor protein C with HTH and peptisase S24 domain
METAEAAFAAAVDARLKALKTNAFAVERAHGLPQDAVRSILRGTKKSGTTLNSAQQVCDALGLEIRIGPPGAQAADTPACEVVLDGVDYAAIPRVDTEASAGPGALGGSTEVIGALAFRRDWLRGLGVDPRRALLVTITGDSMAPRIAPGDLVLLDLARQELRDGGLYIFTDADGATRLKRLQRLDRRTLALLCDNPHVPTELRHGPDAARVRILGQVMWWAHTER